MALLVTPNNPALEAADPAVAPELDQRGFPRVGTPDVGSFEAGNDDGGELDGLPPLAEKVAVNSSLINGVDADLLRGDGVTPFKITFVGAVAAQDNTIGYYIVQEDDGSGGPAFIVEVGILFESSKDAVPGAAVQVDVWEGAALGMFLIADGADLNGDRLADNPNLSFSDAQGNSATVADIVPTLIIDDALGFGPVAGNIIHASDYVEDDRGNSLNPNGKVRTLSGRGEDGSLLVAWDDRISGSDKDFNDVVVRVEGPGPGVPTGILTDFQPMGEQGPDFLL